jgi:predicted nucleotide-binding protein
MGHEKEENAARVGVKGGAARSLAFVGAMVFSLGEITAILIRETPQERRTKSPPKRKTTMSHRVFIASSSEGLRVAETVKALLSDTLGGLAEVETWDAGTFALTKTYIESLEQEVNKADFAVLVLTLDDELLTRETKTSVPRDNVLFELGLFIGKLGRDRSFYIQPQGLKLPTDLLGIESTKFELPRDFTGKVQVPADRDALRAALGPGCSNVATAISEGIKNLPSLPKLTDGQRAVQKERRRFYDQIEGAWWERISFKGEVQALSFFTIKADDVHNSVCLDGKAYDENGAFRAEWKSAAARLEDRGIIYVRLCHHHSPDKRPKWLPGLGEINFTGSSGRIDQGTGRFWEGDETHPEETIIKSVLLRRVREENHKSVMEKGSERDQKNLVRTVLRKKRSPVF